MLVRSACKIFVPYLIGTNRPGIASVSVAIGVIVNIVTLLALMPLIGLAGAAIAMTNSYFISSAILVIAFRRATGMGLRQMWLFRRSDWSMLAQAWRSTRSKLSRPSQPVE